MPDPHLVILLERGREFDRRGRKLLRGEPHRCHNLAALYYSRHHVLGLGGACEIVTGYGLDDEVCVHGPKVTGVHCNSKRSRVASSSQGASREKCM